MKAFAIALALAAVAANARDAFLSMAYTNALGEELPFSIFSKHSWAPDPKARFVKLHLYFDQPIPVQGISINTCGAKMDPHMSIFFNFDQLRLQVDSNLSGEVPEAIYPKQHGDTLTVGGFTDSIDVRSLTFNFESNSGFRICGIDLKDPRGASYTVKVPVLAGGSVEASSVLEPRSAYDPVFLFDSRFEYGWATDKQSRGARLTFAFDRQRRIEKLRIWNGYQRSAEHCWSNSRPRRVRFTGDGGYSEVAVLKDILGSQVVELPKPFEGKRLEMEVVDAYLGKSYQDLVLSEIRFFDGKDWFMLDPTANLKEAIARNRLDFAAAKAGPLLNDSYLAEGEVNDASEDVKATLRMRADGSFYLSGVQGEDDGIRYFALGNYEIKRADAGGLKLRLFGLYYESDEYGDCNGCGRDCNRNDDAASGDRPRILQEFISVKPARGGKFEVAIDKGGKRIHFGKLLFAREGKAR
ncbi:MAG: hypothetical protein JF616_01150 [Fibrobacteres bacterium]|nr:hypothetical protein [Fibrobacterota bacterium]